MLLGEAFSAFKQKIMEAMSLKRICVRLLSGDVVYEGCAPHSLWALREEVAATMGIRCDQRNELVLCSRDAVLNCIEDAVEEITVVRDPVMNLLEEFLRHGCGNELPERIWPAREHRRLILAAVAIDGRCLRHASVELRADRDVVLAAVTCHQTAFRYASVELQVDRDVAQAVFGFAWSVVQTAEGLCVSHTLGLWADRAFVLAAVASNGHALKHASPELRADRDLVLAAVTNNGYAVRHASAELQADSDVVGKSMASLHSIGAHMRTTHLLLGN